MGNIDKELLLADKLNSLTLNREDLLNEALLFMRYSSRESEEKYNLINELLSDQVFTDSCLRCVYESTVMAVNSFLLGQSIQFDKILYEFLFSKSQLTSGLNIEIIDFAFNLLTELRLQVYSKVLSQNKLSGLNSYNSEMVAKRKEIYYSIVNEINI